MNRSGDGTAALGMLQHSLDVLTGHAGKPLEEIVDARPALEILERLGDEPPADERSQRTPIVPPIGSIAWFGVTSRAGRRREQGT